MPSERDRTAGIVPPGQRLPFGGRMRVSVVIPTRNRRDLLLRALRSIAMQTYSNWDVLVVDDGSTDGTVEAVKALGDSRIRVAVNDQSRGGGYSRWWGAGNTSGDYVAFLDSDDTWMPDKLRLQLEAAENDGRDGVVIVGAPIADDGLRLVEIRQPELEPGQRIADYVYAGRQATILSSCLLIEGNLARRVRFNPALLVNQDTDYLLRLERSGACFICISKPLYVLDVRPRGDRVSLNPQLIERSIEWYQQVSRDWSAAARRGFLMWDLSVRCASSQQRWRGLRYFLRGFSMAAGPRRVVHQLLRVLGGGDVPLPLKRLNTALSSSESLDRSTMPPPVSGTVQQP